jgi:hypothetical protein
MGCRHCPVGHELAAGVVACRLCRVATITAVVASACPELAVEQIAAAVKATITSGAVARDLVVALADGPGVLAGGAPPVVGRLVAELRSRGSVLAVPACAHCGRIAKSLIRVGVIGLCGRCRAHQLAEPCSRCGRVRVVAGRAEKGAALCFACAPRPQRTCGRCGRVGPIAARACGGEPDICNSCFRSPVATCGTCGRDKPCSFVAAGRPVCASCSPRASSVCAHCTELRPACARWPEGPVCEPCYRAALSRRGTCEACRQDRRLVSPPGVDARRCADCAGVAPLARCAGCGIEDRGYRHGRCVRCALAERAAVLLGGPRPELAAIYDAIVATAQPYSAHNWLRSAPGAAILGRIASGTLPLTHEALDAEAHPKAAGFLRQLLVANEVLVARTTPWSAKLLGSNRLNRLAIFNTLGYSCALEVVIFLFALVVAPGVSPLLSIRCGWLKQTAFNRGCYNVYPVKVTPEFIWNFHRGLFQLSGSVQFFPCQFKICPYHRIVL